MAAKDIKKEFVTKKQILISIAQGAGDTADGATKGQVVNWLVTNVGHARDSRLKAEVEKLLKDGKKRKILIRGKNNSRYKLADTSSAEYKQLKAEKVERVKVKAVAPAKSKPTTKKLSPKAPPDATANKNKKTSRVYTDDPFTCHGKTHPEYDNEKCEPAMTGQYCISICDMLDARHVNVSVDLEVNKKKISSICVCC
eukprot:UN01707